MDNNTAVLERLTEDTTEPLGRPPTSHSQPCAAPILAVAGLLCIGLAVALLAHGDRVTLGPDLTDPEVVVTDGEYEPNHSSGWHVHPGLHSVVVLTGTLTVYDERCGRHEFGPGEAYLGGERPHLARNETSDPVTYVVTYARMPSSRLDPGTTVPAPPGCEPR